jgi:DNA-directed RNA polymerase sigma subunit (sigma70/sigma32)
MYWIRSAVKRSQIFQSRIIPVPQRLYENHKRLQRVEAELKATLGRQPTRKELGDAVGMSETQVQRSFKAMDQRCFSLDAEVTNKLKPNSGDRENSSMYELVQSKTDDGTNKLKRIFVREDLIETLNRHLDPDAVDLLLLRYGLMDEKTLPHGFSGPLTIAEVSSLVGLKPDKVRRMINNSLKQLKFLIGDEWEDFERVIE